MDNEFESLEQPSDDHITSPQLKSKKQRVLPVSTTNTSYRPSHSGVPLSKLFEEGGRACNKCKKIISHDESLGFWDTSFTRFTIVGYFCKGCNDRWLYEKYRKEEKRAANKFHTMSFWERHLLKLSE